MPVAADEPMEDLFARARAGDQVAWRSLFDLSYPKVRRVVRRKMDPPMRSLYDSTDFASDVWSSLVAKFDRFEFDSMESFVAFLKKAAVDKVVDEHRRLNTLKRDRKRECRLDDGTEERPGLGAIVASTDPSPSQVAVAKDSLERVRSSLDEPKQRALDLAMEGHTTQEIADHMSWNLRRVQRFMEKLRVSMHFPGARLP